MLTNTHIRKIMSDILARKVRTALVASSIFIGVLGVIALFTTRDLTRRQLEADVKGTELSMIDVYVGISDGVVPDNEQILATLNQENAEGQALAALDGIERAEGQAYYPITFQKPDGSGVTEGELRAYSSPLADLHIEPLALTEGRFPAIGQQEVVLEQRMAARYGFEVDDDIMFSAVTESGVEDVAYQVVGLVFHPYSFRRQLPTGNLSYGPTDGIYAEYADAQALLKFTGYSAILARYKTYEQALLKIDDFSNTVDEISPYVPVTVIPENPEENAQLLLAENINNVLSLLGLVTMLVSSFLVINVVNTIMAEQKKQVGVLKSLGASTRDNFIMYGGIAVAYGIIGTIPAIFAGIIVGYVVALSLSTVLNIYIDSFGWSPPSVLLGAVMGITIPVFAAFIPIYNGIRISIMEAMTDLGIESSYGQGGFANLIGWLPLPISIRQAVSNVYQKKGRLVLTGVTLVLAMGSFMGVMAITVSLTNELHRVFDRADYQMTVLLPTLVDQDRMENLILAQDGVEKVSDGAIISIAFEGSYINYFTQSSQVAIYGNDMSKTYIYEFDYVEGDGWSNDPERIGIVMTQSVAAQLGASIGDEIGFTVGGRRYTRELIGIDSAAFDFVWLTWHDAAELANLRRGGPTPNEYVEFARIAGRSLPVPALGLSDEFFGMALQGDHSAEGVIITATLADALGVVAGDELEVTIGENVGTYPIASVVANEILKAGVAQLSPDQAAPVPDDVLLFRFNDMVTLTGVTLGGELTPNAYYTTVVDRDLTSDEVADLIRKMDQNFKQEGVNATFFNTVAQNEELSLLIFQNTAVLMVAALLIAAVGSIGLLTTLSIAVFERQKEIGVMRSIGAGSFVIAFQFIMEGLIVGLISWVLALPLSYLLALAVNMALNLENIAFNYPIIVPITGLLGMMVISGLASFGPSMAAARRTVSEILRYQ